MKTLDPAAKNTAHTPGFLFVLNYKLHSAIHNQYTCLYYNAHKKGTRVEILLKILIQNTKSILLMSLSL